MITRKVTVIALLFTIVFFIAACSNKSETAKQPVNLDTVGLAEYQRWKMNNELQRQEISSPKSNEVNVVQSKSSYTKRTSSNTAKRNSSSQSTSANTAPVSIVQQPAKKKLSHTAKGAIVGAASGAVIGAIANKNHVGGGVVGGVIGAATGAGIGIIVDNKEKKKKVN